MSTTHSPVRQVTLPGQAHTAEGPHDHVGMYVMHFSFRRDLANFVSAVGNTPLGDDTTWRALQARWRLFAEILHHHHTAEDEHYWPALAVAARARGTAEDEATIVAMEHEHAAIDPALTACADGFEEVVTHPCDAHRNALEIRLTTLREALDAHLAHEERETLPLVQRVMTTAEFAASEKAIEQAYPPKLIISVLPWVTHRLPTEASTRLFATGGPVIRLLYRLARGRFERREQIAFRHSDAVLPE